SDEQRPEAVQAAKGVPGVHRVELRVEPPRPEQVASKNSGRESPSIQGAVEDKLRGMGLLQTSGSDQGLTVAVDADVVTLTGVLAEEKDRDAALEAARRIAGVRSVENRINVRGSWGAR